MKKLKNKIKELEHELKEEQSCCPHCGSKRWSRPGRYDNGDYKTGKYIRDWNNRRCSNCNHVYPNP